MTSTDARRLLDGFLARMDAGELPDLDALLRDHPEHADELRRLFAAECERLDPPPPTDDRADSQVLARLAGRRDPFSRYSVRGEIGRGGMGSVLAVRDEDLRRDLAMKVTSGSDVARFLEEAQITGQLDHPGIVPVHEIGLDPEGRVYFTMKLVQGRTLAQVLDLVRDGRDGWTQAKVLGAIQRVCEAMAYAHQKGVIHRDLKPSNVMIGAFGEVYVMDWGLARVVGAPGPRDVEPAPPVSTGRSGLETDRGELRHATPGSSLLTRDGQVVGTPAYMPPEQAAGRVDELGPHSDVFAVGAMIYHLLAGRPPHEGRIPEAEPPPIESLAPRAPAELAAICAKAMRRDGRERYRDMSEMAEDLSAFLENRVVRAHATGALAEARKWVRRNRGLAAALAGAVLALVAGLVASLVLKSRSDASSLSAQTTAAFLEETLAGVQPSVAMGRDTTMLREMMDAALARIDRGELAAAPEAELRLRYVIGSAYQAIGSYDLAEPLLRRTVEEARAMLPGDDPLKASILAELTVLLDNRGQAAEAEALAHESLSIRRRLHPGDHVDVAAGLQNLATVMRSRGDLAEAERLLREACAMHERLAPAFPEAFAICWNNLGVVLEERGRLDEAEQASQRALDLRKRLYPGDHPLVASNLNSLATLRAGRGDLAGAEELHRETLAMRRRLFSGASTDTASSLNNLGFVLYKRKAYAEAETYFQEALDMQRRLISGDHADLAAAMDNLAAAKIGRGDDAGAEPLQLEALEMRRRLAPGGHPDLALSLHNLGARMRLRGEPARAEPYAREALEMADKVLPPEHPTLPTIAIGLARIRVLLGDHAGAERLLLERAVGRMEAAYASGLAEVHEAWEKAEPGRGHAEQAAVWRAKAPKKPN